jgi:hypothetical protein
MVHARDDVLELLLPGAPEELQRRAISLTTFARLLASDAQDVRSPSVAVTLDHAAREFERDGAERRRAALRELMIAHLSAALRASSFLWLGEPSADAPELWRRLHASSGEPLSGAHVPLPGEGALAVAARLFDAAARSGFDEDELALWRVRHRWASDGARAIVGELDAACEQARAARSPRWPTWLAHRVEAALERGAVRHARAWLDEHARCIAGDERLVQLAQWTRLAAGETPERAALWRGPVPLALAEWRSASPSMGPFLAGREPTSLDRGDARADGRHDLGASVLVVVAVGDDGGSRVLLRDVAAGLRARLDTWLAGRDGAACSRGTPEQRAVATARRAVLRREGVQPLGDALDAERCLALVLEPVLDRRGEVAGWLWLEFEHRLVPSSTELASAAAAWSARVLDAHEQPSEPAVAASHLSEGAASIPSRCFDALVDDLAMKTAQRRWWGFVVEGERVRVVASGGAEQTGLAGSTDRAGAPPRDPERARIVERVLRTRGWVQFDEPAPDFSVHPSAASGVALAIECAGRARAVLAIESTRRRDFKAADLERWGERAAAHAADFAAADFRAWHRARHGLELWFDRGERLARRLAEVAAAANCRAPVAIVGPAGAGKTVLARWLHFERHGAGSNGPTVVADLARDLASLAHGGHRGTLLVPHADGLSPSQQAELVRALTAGPARDGDAVRVIVTLTEPPSALATRGAWSRELAEVFAHLELRVPPLAARRIELPGLIASLLVRFGEREQRAPPRLDDDALALLWRREWRRNLRELEAVAYRLVIGHAGREVDAETLTAELARMGLDAPRKLSSRRAEPGWIAEALETTRHESGGVNKTRAAAYLGWDPDTLVARMRELGIDGERARA